MVPAHARGRSAAESVEEHLGMDHRCLERMEQTLANYAAMPKVDPNDVFHDLQEKVAWAMSQDRAGAVRALRLWLDDRSSPRTGYAVDLVQMLGVRELAAEVSAIAREIRGGQFMQGEDPLSRASTLKRIDAWLAGGA